MKQYLLGAAFMLLIISLTLNGFLIGRVSQFIITPDSVPTISLKELGK